jgi:hypothetical protein
MLLYNNVAQKRLFFGSNDFAVSAAFGRITVLGRISFVRRCVRHRELPPAVYCETISQQPMKRSGTMTIRKEMQAAAIDAAA